MRSQTFQGGRCGNRNGDWMRVFEKFVSATALLVIMATNVPAGVQMEQRWELEERSSMAARTLQNIYVLTLHQSMRVVYANAWAGRVCIEYLTDDARSQPIIRYAVLEKNSKFVEFDLDEEDIVDRCNLAGIDLTEVAERELKAVR